MVFTNEVLIIIGAILLVCLIGFKKYIWFISIGYGLSISVVGILLLILYRDMLSIPYILGCIVLICYGFRLSGYLLFRELKSAAYNRKMKTEISDGKNMPFIAKIMLWISCALLYFMMTSPVIFRFVNNVKYDNYFIIGMVIAVLGILIEALSDYQKSKQKKKNPNRFCDKGLFKIVRCPNYLGELIIWTGIIISGIGIYYSYWQFIISMIGYLGIVYIMFSGARRLELRQDKNYGKDKDYKKYVKNTPILIPLVPLYSVKKHKWLVG